MYRHFFKRFIDLVLSILGLIVLVLPIIIISIAIKMDSPGPVVFKQVRLGKNKKLFTVYKFRTMCDHAYENGGIVKGENDCRITKVGAFLRKTSLDEILQLWNIIKNDMAIIGPRPILDWEYEEFANEKYESRFYVKPGMFCTVDLDYRANASRELQFEMDATYEKEVSFKLDVKVFFGIIKTVISGSNVYATEKKEIDKEKEHLDAKH